MLRQCKALILLTTSTNSENFIGAQIVCMTIFRLKNSNLQFQLYCLTSIISAVLKLITRKDRKVSTTGMGIIVSLILLHFTIGKVISILICILNFLERHPVGMENYESISNFSFREMKLYLCFLSLPFLVSCPFHSIVIRNCLVS